MTDPQAVALNDNAREDAMAEAERQSLAEWLADRLGELPQDPGKRLFAIRLELAGLEAGGGPMGADIDWYMTLSKEYTRLVEEAERVG